MVGDVRRLLLALGLVVAGALASCGGPDDPFVGRAPPSLDAPSGTWLGADPPLTWKGLIGQVVYLQFGFLH